MKLPAIVILLSLSASSYAALTTSTIRYGNCWNYFIAGTSTKFIPGATVTAHIPYATTTTLTSWIFQEGDPPYSPKRHEPQAAIPAQTPAPEADAEVEGLPEGENGPIEAREYLYPPPPPAKRDEALEKTTVIATNQCTKTITLGLTTTLTVPVATITASATVYAATVTKWFTSTSYCGQWWVNC